MQPNIIITIVVVGVGGVKITTATTMQSTLVELATAKSKFNVTKMMRLQKVKSTIESNGQQ